MIVTEFGGTLALLFVGLLPIAWLFAGWFSFVWSPFQVTTLARPVLWRSADRPMIERERVFFLEHFGRILNATESGDGTAKP